MGCGHRPTGKRGRPQWVLSPRQDADTWMFIPFLWGVTPPSRVGGLCSQLLASLSQERGQRALQGHCSARSLLACTTRSPTLTAGATTPDTATGWRQDTASRLAHAPHPGLSRSGAAGRGAIPVQGGEGALPARPAGVDLAPHDCSLSRRSIMRTTAAGTVCLAQAPTPRGPVLQGWGRARTAASHTRPHLGASP